MSLIATFLHFYDRKDLKYNFVLAASAEEEVSGWLGGTRGGMDPGRLSSGRWSKRRLIGSGAAGAAGLGAAAGAAAGLGAAAFFSSSYEPQTAFLIELKIPIIASLMRHSAATTQS